jgi:hypothetical protein
VNQEEQIMRSRALAQVAFFVLLIAIAAAPLMGQDTSPSLVSAKMLVTVGGQSGKRLPDITPEDIVVRQGNSRLKVTEWTPARGENGGSALFILVDDSLDPVVGGLFGDVRSFIQAQSSTTLVGVGYMTSGTTRVAQDLTSDHDKAKKALRLPLGNPGAYGSVYLSLADLIKRWPDNKGRKEVIMITDGVDRLRGQYSRLSALQTSPDLTTASEAAQKAGVLVFALYARGTGYRSRNSWILFGAQNGLSRIADETGGEAFYLGYQNPVSFKPYLERIQEILGNQYWLGFEIRPGKKSGLQYVDVDTQVSGVEINAPASVFVPAGK